MLTCPVYLRMFTNEEHCDTLLFERDKMPILQLCTIVKWGRRLLRELCFSWHYASKTPLLVCVCLYKHPSLRFSIPDRQMWTLLYSCIGRQLECFPCETLSNGTRNPFPVLCVTMSVFFLCDSLFIEMQCSSIPAWCLARLGVSGCTDAKLGGRCNGHQKVR